jgi:hypothetical protein
MSRSHPNGHTSFTWIPKNGSETPRGHTPYSWGLKTEEASPEVVVDLSVPPTPTELRQLSLPLKLRFPFPNSKIDVIITMGDITKWGTGETKKSFSAVEIVILFWIWCTFFLHDLFYDSFACDTELAFMTNRW